MKRLPRRIVVQPSRPPCEHGGWTSCVDPEHLHCRMARQRRKDTLQHYGWSVVRFISLLAIQKGRCAICSARLGDALCADHTTTDDGEKKPRGLLCRPCNLGLGNFMDDPELLMHAAKYLQEWE